MNGGMQWHPNCLGQLLALVLVLLTVDATADEPRQRGRHQLVQTASLAPPPVVRELHVPMDQLHLLFDTPQERVLLSRAEYQNLLEHAKQQPVESPAKETLLSDAEYQLRITNNSARLTGALEVHLLTEGLHAIALPMARVGIRRAIINGKPAALGRGADGVLRLFVNGKGRQRLELDMTVDLTTTAARQSVDFQVPVPAAARLTLLADGDIEVKSGNPVLRREFIPSEQQTELEFLLVPGVFSCAMTLNSRLKREHAVVVARSVQVSELNEAAERLHARFSLDVRHRPVMRHRFRVPAGFEVVQVESSALVHWSVEGPEDERVLTLHARGDQLGGQAINIVAFRDGPIGMAWTMPTFEPVDIAAHTAVVGLVLDQQLNIATVRDELLALDHAVLRLALPETLTTSATDQTQRTVLAYYAPTGRAKLSATFQKTPVILKVTSNSLLEVADNGLTLRGGYALIQEGGRMFDFAFTVPSGWDVESVTDEAGKALRMERQFANPDAQRVRVWFEQAVPMKTETRVFFTARHVPNGWFNSGPKPPATFPLFRVLSSHEDSGAIAVQAHGDYEVHASDVAGLSPLDDAEKTRFGLDGTRTDLAYRYDTHPFVAQLIVARRLPRVTAESYAFYKLERGALNAHYELLYQVEDAKIRTLALSLPEETPTTISIRGIGTTVKAYQPLNQNDQRLWEVELSEDSRGTIQLALSFQQPLSDISSDAISLPPITAERVNYQSGFVAVEGSADLDIRLHTDEQWRQVDVGELATANYTPGKRLLGAYAFVGEPSTMTLTAQDPAGYALPPAIVHNAHFQTVMGGHGVTQTAATFVVQSQNSFVALLLPGRSRLWAVSVNDRPTRPRLGDGQMLLELPTNHLRPNKIRVVYETTIPKLTDTRNVHLDAVALAIPAGRRSTPQPIPAMDSRWQLFTPHGFHIARAEGSAEASHQPGTTKMAAYQLALWVYNCGGGIGQYERLANLLMAPLSEARVSAYEHLESEQGHPANEYLNAAQSFAQTTVGGEQQAAGFSPMQLALVDNTPNRQPLPWAESGQRGLDIAFAPTGQSLTFRSLGDRPQLALTVVDNSRVRQLAWGSGLLVILAGLALLRRSAQQRRQYCLAVLLGASALAAVPALSPWVTVLNGGFYAACGLLPIYFVVHCWGRLKKAGRAQVVSTVCGLLLWSFPSTSQADMTRHDALLESPAPPSVTIPDDVIIVPYDPTSPSTRSKGEERIMVPYKQFMKLRERGLLKELRATTDRDFVVASAEYTTVLSEDQPTLVGTVAIDLFTDDVVHIPLKLQGAVLLSAQLGKREAPLQASPSIGKSAGHMALRLSGQGRHVLTLRVRPKVERRGGWRVLSGVLPSAPAATLAITVPTPATELRLLGTHDRKHHETERPNQQIETSLPEQGAFRIQWRPQINEGDVDRTLTATSIARVDLQEDRVQLTWQLTAKFRRGERDTFAFKLPPGYVVEDVTGDNVRGWQLGPRPDAGHTLTVSLLRRVRDQERVTLTLWHPRRNGGGDEQIALPAILLQGAVRQTGYVAVWRSPGLDVQTLNPSGIERTELPEDISSRLQSAIRRESPLGVKPFQTYHFTDANFRLDLQMRPTESDIAMNEQSIVRVAELERTLESQLRFRIRNKPVHQLHLSLPANVNINTVILPAPGEWTDTLSPDGTRRHLSIYLQRGQLGTLAVLLRARLGNIGTARQLALPDIHVLNGSRQEGEIVIQSDPALDVQVSALNGLDSVLLQHVMPWLSEPQRPFARLALRYSSAKHSGQLHIAPLTADVSCMTVTNTRIGDHNIEHTLLLNFEIQRAGVREIQFRLPKSFADAQIRAPMLRRKMLESVAGGDDILVRLLLQDAVMDQFRVIVEDDELLTRDIHQVPVPQVRTGRVTQQYLAVENAGRDEVEIVDKIAVAALTLQQREWAAVAALLSGQSTQIFIVNDGDAKPTLSFNTRERSTVETAGAAIGLAQAILVMDGHGAFRCQQTYHVDNQTEQFLNLEIPRGVDIWSVKVAGTTVRPVEHPGGLRVPLVKTAAGDLDYTVVVRYGGQSPQPLFHRSLEFPLLKTTNINVERSQVELRLPKSIRWFDFGGSMRPVASLEDYHADELRYHNRVAKRLLQTMQFGDDFEQVRSVTNLDQQIQRVNALAQRQGKGKDSEDAKRIAQLFTQRQVALKKQQDNEEILANSRRLNEFSAQQRNGLAHNQVLELASNFHLAEAQMEEQQVIVEDLNFNDAWLAENQLGAAVNITTDLDDAANLGDQNAVILNDTVQIDLPKAGVVEKNYRYAAGKAAPSPQQDTLAGKVPKKRSRRARAQVYQQRLLQQSAVANITAAQQGDITLQLPSQNDELSLTQQAHVTTVQAHHTGTPDLDVSLPAADSSRWVTYHFTTPRAATELRARGMSAALIEQIARYGLVLLLLASLIALRRFRPRIRLGDHRVLVVLAVLGLLGLLFGIFPVYSLMALLGTMLVGVLRRLARLTS